MRYFVSDILSILTLGLFVLGIVQSTQTWEYIFFISLLFFLFLGWIMQIFVRKNLEKLIYRTNNRIRIVSFPKIYDVDVNSLDVDFNYKILFFPSMLLSIKDSNGKTKKITFSRLNLSKNDFNKLSTRLQNIISN
ncbi:MAG: hypothetical protein GX372_08715 [Ignavibacteria bacterium]|jgi:hypothetical protein|nr:hypothetical protein [Ignavibacteria bacterium]